MLFYRDTWTPITFWTRAQEQKHYDSKDTAAWETGKTERDRTSMQIDDRSKQAKREREKELCRCRQREKQREIGSNIYKETWSDGNQQPGDKEKEITDRGKCAGRQKNVLAKRERETRQAGDKQREKGRERKIEAEIRVGIRLTSKGTSQNQNKKKAARGCLKRERGTTQKNKQNQGGKPTKEPQINIQCTHTMARTQWMFLIHTAVHRTPPWEWLTNTHIHIQAHQTHSKGRQMFCFTF